MEEDKIEKDEKNEEETKEGVKNMEKEDESKQTDVEEKKQKIEKKNEEKEQNEETYTSAETTQSEIKEGTEKETKELEEDDAQEKEIQKNEENKEEVNEIKTNEEEQQSNKEKKSIVPVVIITILICLALFFSIIFALININNENILSGISIMNVDVSKLSKEDALKKINEIVASKETEDITLKCGDYETVINGKQFSIKFDTEKAINEAYNVGKDGNIIVNNYNILLTQILKKNIEIPVYYDEDALNKKVEDISSKIPGAVKQSSYYVEDEKLIIVKGTAGIKIKENEIKKSIIDEIKKIDNKNNIVTIPVENVEPDEIDVIKIRNEIYKEPQDAYVTKNPTKVHPHVNGIDFKITIEEAQKIVQEDKKEYTIPLKITIPKKTISNLGEEAFPELLSTYTTRYDASNYNRSNNLSIAASKINGTVLMPGETFSYNKVVGARTIEAGYKEAGAYAGGGVVQSVGGGICQISSTVYNTALLANLEIVDRSNHQFETSYVAASRDATVSWGYLDFKFKNNRTYPIKITASAKNGVAKVSIYGIKEETEYEVVIQSRILSYIPYSVKYIEDSSLAQGKEVVEQSGHNGCKSEAYRILKLNGQVVSKTLLSRDTYDPMQRIVRRGTKKPTTTTKPTTLENQNSGSNSSNNNQNTNTVSQPETTNTTGITLQETNANVTQ